MKIGFDLDDVLVDFVPSFLEFFNRTSQFKFTKEMIHCYDMTIPLGISHKAFDEVINEFYKSEKFGNLTPQIGALEYLPAIKMDNELVIVTGRPKRVEDITFELVNKYFSEFFSGVYLSHQEGISKTAIVKGEHCKKLGLNLLVEDCLEYAVECSKNGTKALLLDAPWNECDKEFEKKHNLTRVYNWEDIAKKIYEHE